MKFSLPQHTCSQQVLAQALVDYLSAYAQVYQPNGKHQGYDQIGCHELPGKHSLLLQAVTYMKCFSNNK